MSPWIAFPCWILVSALLIDLIWRDRNCSMWKRHIPLSALTLAVTGLLCYRSIVGPLVKLGTVNVAFSESKRIPATSVPFSDGLENGMSILSKSIQAAPVQELRLAPKTGKVVMNVIVQNSSDIPIQNAHIQIMSNVPIRGMTMGVYSFSEVALSYEKRILVPFRKLGQESMFSIEFENEQSIPLAGLTVTIDGDNMKPYVGVGKFKFVREP